MKNVNQLLFPKTGKEGIQLISKLISIWNYSNSVLRSLIGMLFLFAATLKAESLIEQIGWKGADSKIIVSIIIVFFLAFIVLLSFHFHSRIKGKQDQQELSDQMFNEFIENAELSGIEIDILNKLISSVNISEHSMIFQSIAIFEQCIENEIADILNKNLPADELADENILLSGIRKKLGFNLIPYEHPLVSSRNIEVGQKVSLYSKNINKASKGFHATVTMNTEFVLRIQVAFEEGENIIVNTGDIVKLAFARQGDGIYGIDMKAVSFDGTSIIDLRHTLEMKRNQLRQFVRIEVNFPIKIRIVKAVSEEDKLLVGKLFEAKVIDISGGGLSFILNKPLVPGEKITMSFQIKNAAFSGLSGKILRVSLIEGKTATMYRHHVTFSEIGQSMREKIIKYVFEKQRQINQWR